MDVELNFGSIREPLDRLRNPVRLKIKEPAGVVVVVAAERHPESLAERNSPRPVALCMTDEDRALIKVDVTATP